jgi:tetratricopeptide (TPR) repeat protein
MLVLLLLIYITSWLWMLVDCWNNEKLRSADKFMGFLMVLALPLGAIVYFAYGRKGRPPLEGKDAAAWCNAGKDWHAKKDFDRAIESFGRSLWLDPEYLAARCARGDAWFAKKEYGLAIDDYNSALRIDRKLVAALSKRGLAWFHKEDYEKALADYDASIRLNPWRAEAHADRAWLLATCPEARFRDGKKAIQSAEKACELSGWEVGPFISTLAAAYAEAGEFESALRWQKEAIDLHDGGSEENAEDYQRRLKLYEKRKSFRQT